MTSASVGRLWHYPVKSMQGEEVQEVLLGSGGVVGDRAYGFLDIETGRLVSAKRPKRFGALFDCKARFLSSPTEEAPSPPIEVIFPDGTVVRDDESELTRRVTELLGREVRLITTAPEGLTFEELWPKLEGFGPDALADAMQIEPPDEQGDRVIQFPVAMAAPGTLLDVAALHVLATGTLRTLAAEYPDGDWDPRRFRPNILFDDGGELTDEDDWLACDLHIGAQAVIHIVGSTPRCVMTTLAQAELPRDPRVLRAIARVGRKEIAGVGQFACAGSYAEVVQPGVVRSGDPVRVERVQPRAGALAAMNDMLAAGFAANP
jgi:uncharacterized protein